MAARTITIPANNAVLSSSAMRNQLQLLENEIALSSSIDPGHLHTPAGVSATGTPSATTFWRGDNTWSVPATTSGTVTTVSVVSANGFTGTVTNPTTTPAITLTTSINSAVLAGNGTAITAAPTTGTGTTVMLNAGPTVSTTMTVGTVSSTTGVINLKGITSGTVSLSVANAAGTWTMKLPTSAGSSGQVLTTDGTNQTSWASVSGTGDVVGPGSATDNAVARFDGTTGKLIQNSAVTIADSTGVISGTQGVNINGSTSGTVLIKTAAIAGTWTLTLPTDDGNSGQFLQTNGSGVTTWATGGGGGGSPGGVNTDIQFNDTGSFGGESTFTFDKTTNTVTLGEEGTGNGGLIDGVDATTNNTDGGFLVVEAGNGKGSGDGGELDLYGGSGDVTGNGGTIVVSAGAAGATSGSGGDITFDSGDATGVGSAGDILITGGSGGFTSGDGGEIDITGGNARGGDSNGGLVDIRTGNSSGANDGPDIRILVGSAGVDGGGGDITVNAGDGGSNGSTIGGSITMGAGAGNGAQGGFVQITGGTPTGAAGAGGAFSIISGFGRGASNGGAMTVRAGSAQTGAGTGAGGALNLESGNGGGTSGGGAPINITAGNALAGNSVGGDIISTAGKKAGSGRSGQFQFIPKGATTVVGILDFDSLATTDKTFTFPNNTGTIALTSDIPAAGANTALSNLASVAINTSLLLGSSDGGALGSTSKQWSDLFLAEGGVINWDNGDFTLTQAGNSLTADGGVFNANADIGIRFGGTLHIFNASDNDEATISNSGGSGASIIDFGGTPTRWTFDAAVTPVSNDGAALGTTALSWSDLFLASGAVLNIANGNWVATHTSGILTVGTGDLRVTTAGTNSASVVTVGGAQTLTSKVLTAATVTTSLVPTSNDGAPLGDTTHQFSDLFLAEGGVINFDNGDLTLTQTNNELVLAGGNLDIGAGNILRLPAGATQQLTVPTSDGTATGPTTSSFVSGYTSSAIGDLVYLDTNAKWQKTDADALSTTTGLLGIALAVAATDAALLVALPGSFVYATAFPTLTVGAPYYVGETAGAIQATIPTGADGAIRVVGFAFHADKLFFNPSSDTSTVVA